VEAWGVATPALTRDDRIIVFWEHFIDGRWDMVLARKPATSYRSTATTTKYSVPIVFKPGKWRVRATAVLADGGQVSSAVRYFWVR